LRFCSPFVSKGLEPTVGFEPTTCCLRNSTIPFAGAFGRPSCI
jgi:hypothetical protein